MIDNGSYLAYRFSDVRAPTWLIVCCLTLKGDPRNRTSITAREDCVRKKSRFTLFLSYLFFFYIFFFFSFVALLVASVWLNERSKIDFASEYKQVRFLLELTDVTTETSLAN